LATDGLDGVSEVAGGIVDGLSYKRSIESGLNIEESLNNNDSYTFFKSLSDVICTGPTGTNVNDLTVILCG
jgi:glycerate-2-kinase